MALKIDLSGKTAIVTGTSSGIGAGIAQVLAQAGANVVGCGRSDEASDSAQAFLSKSRDAGVQAIYKQANVENPSDLEALVQAALSSFGRIDILVSNAGVNVFKGAEACSEDDWKRNIDLNLASHWRLAKLCLPHLKKTNGVVEIMTSNQAYATIPGCFPYNVTKTALTGLVRALAIEWGPAVRVVGIAPGFIDTAGNDKWFESFPDPAAERARTIALHPAGKLGSCEEVGGWCVFLASEYAKFCTGMTYVMDGGRLALLQDTPPV